MTTEFYMREHEIYFGWNNDTYCIDRIPLSTGFRYKMLLRGDTLFSTASGIPVTLNKEPLPAAKCPVREGDLLEGDGWSCYIQNGYLELIKEKSGSVGLLPVEGPHLPNGFPQYTRSPRLFKEPDTSPIEIMRPKDLHTHNRAKLWTLILPPLAIITAMGIMCFIMRNPVFLIIAGITSTVSVIISISRYISDRKQGKQERHLRTKTYTAYLEKKRKIIYDRRAQERETDRYYYPDPESFFKMADEYSSRIYEKKPSDMDFLSVSLGYGDMSPFSAVSFTEDELELEKDPLAKQAEQIVEENSSMAKPVVISARDSHLGMVGQGAVLRTQMMYLLLQVSLFHSYHDIRFIIMTDTDRFDWAKWLPHTWFPPSECYGFINSERTRDLILSPLYDILKNRDSVDSTKTRFSPHFIIINDNTEWCVSHPVMDYLGKKDPSLGFTYICLSETQEALTENIGTEVKYYDAQHGELCMADRRELHVQFSAQPDIPASKLDRYARQMSALEHVQNVAAQIPKRCTFFELYGKKTVSEFDVTALWAVHDVNRSIAVPIGLRTKDDLFFIDMHETAHGPHGLIAGTTGSGKSELLQTFILSLACCFHPYEVAFLLIDYKGGGMARLFTSLPHVLGIITNLDGGETVRTMKSISAELERRQRLFNKLGVNNINSYTQKYRMGDADEPLPHLFIISDEFAELKQEQPDFMKKLVSAARVGRSLGVHLILATQKPSGIIDEQIRSNMHMSIALRTATRQDSKEVLGGSGDAAFITNPGRAYIKVGENEQYDLFQSAWSGAVYAPAKGQRMAGHDVYLVNDLGQQVPLRSVKPNSPAPMIEETELQVLCAHITECFQCTGQEKARSPWLPPLSEHICNPYAPAITCDGFGVNIGMVDIPEEQCVTEYCHSFTADGHIMFIGAPESGKTTFLSNIILSLSTRHSPEECMFYIVDLGSGGLAAFRDLYHTSSYIVANDEERLNKLTRILQAEVEGRRQRLVDTGMPDIRTYNSTQKDKMRTIFVVIDNLETIYELDIDRAILWGNLCRAGAGLGIYFAVTANRYGGVRISMHSNFNVRIAGALADDSEATSILGRSEYKSSPIEGRCRIKYQGRVQQMQVYDYTQTENAMERSNALRQMIAQVNSQFDSDVRAPQIPVLPEYFPSTKMFDYPKDSNDIYLGLEAENVRCCGFNRDTSPFIIMGESGRGKKNALSIIISQLADRGEPLYIFDSKSMPFIAFRHRQNVHYSGNDEQVRNSLQQLQELSENRKYEYEAMRNNEPDKAPGDVQREMKPLWVIFNDWDDFIEHTQNTGYELSKVKKTLEYLNMTGGTLVATSDPGKMKGYDEASKFMKNSVSGLLLGSQGTHTVFNMPVTSRMMPFKFGYLFINGNKTLIKLPLFKDTQII